MTDSKELARNPESVSQQALETQFMRYANGRQHTFGETKQAWQVGDKSEWGMNRLQAHYELLEDVGEVRNEQESEPDITICMPVAMLYEEDLTTLRGLTALRRASNQYGKSIDIVLWANARGVSINSAREARARYESLRGKIAGLDGDGFRIRTALQILPKDEAEMSTVRANFMDAVAMDAHKRGFTFEHPVMWLDADTTFVAGNGLDPLIEKVRSIESLFVHANLQHTIDWARSRPLEELDDTTRAIAVHEMVRRMDANGAGEQMTTGYVEESGLAFALGTYLWAGGVSTLMRINESHTLLESARFRLTEDVLPEYVTRNKLGTKRPEIVTRIPALRIGTSARRLNVTARVEGINALNKRGRNYNIVGLFTDTDPTKLTTADQNVTRKEMDDLLMIDRGPDKDKVHWGDKQEREWQRRNRIATRLVDRYFSDTE